MPNFTDYFCHTSFFFFCSSTLNYFCVFFQLELPKNIMVECYEFHPSTQSWLPVILDILLISESICGILFALYSVNNFYLKQQFPKNLKTMSIIVNICLVFNCVTWCILWQFMTFCWPHYNTAYNILLSLFCTVTGVKFVSLYYLFVKRVILALSRSVYDVPKPFRIVLLIAGIILCIITFSTVFLLFYTQDFTLSLYVTSIGFIIYISMSGLILQYLLKKLYILFKASIISADYLKTRVIIKHGGHLTKAPSVNITDKSEIIKVIMRIITDERKSTAVGKDKETDGNTKQTTLVGTKKRKQKQKRKPKGKGKGKGTDKNKNKNEKEKQAKTKKQKLKKNTINNKTKKFTQQILSKYQIDNTQKDASIAMSTSVSREHSRNDNTNTNINSDVTKDIVINCNPNVKNNGTTNTVAITKTNQKNGLAGDFGVTSMSSVSSIDTATTATTTSTASASTAEEVEIETAQTAQTNAQTAAITPRGKVVTKIDVNITGNNDGRDDDDESMTGCLGVGTSGKTESVNSIEIVSETPVPKTFGEKIAGQERNNEFQINTPNSPSSIRQYSMECEITDEALNDALITMGTMVRLLNCVAIAAFTNILSITGFIIVGTGFNYFRAFLPLIAMFDQITNCVCLLFQYRFGAWLYGKYFNHCDYCIKTICLKITLADIS